MDRDGPGAQSARPRPRGAARPRERALDRAAFLALAAGLGLTAALAAAGAAGIVRPARNTGYLERLFTAERVHTIDLAVADWDAFLANASAEEYVEVDAVIDGERLEGVGLRAKGNNSLSHVTRRGLTRFSMKIELDHYRAGLTYHGLDKLSLDASFQDNSYLKTHLAFALMRHLGVPAPATSFAEVRANGALHGLYLAIEEPEDAFARRIWGPFHGALYKPDYRSLEAENADVALCYLGDDPARYPGIFDEALTPVDAGAEARLIRALRLLDAGEVEAAVDVDATLRYFAAQVFVANLDGYLGHTGHNYLLYEDEGRIQMLPWDYNLAFGTYALGRPELADDAGAYVNLPIDEPAAADILARRPLFSRLMEREEYRARYYAYLQELVDGFVGAGGLARTVGRARELIAPYVATDPTAYVTYDEWLAGVDALETFCTLRAESIAGQLSGAIPTTQAGQAAAPGTLVDAGGLDLADLGELADLDR